MCISALVSPILIVSTLVHFFDKVIFERRLSYLGHYIVPGCPTTVHKSPALLSALFTLNDHSSVGVISDKCSTSNFPIVVCVFPDVNYGSPL